MRILLNAGFGEPLGAEAIGLISALGYDGVRQDVPTPWAAPGLVREFAPGPLHLLPIFVVGGLARQPGAEIVETARATAQAVRVWQIQGAAIEIGNEMDAAGWDAREFGALVAAAREAVMGEHADVRVVSGGVTNLSKTALDWLGRAAPDIPADVVIGYHSYRDDPARPKEGFRSRVEEFDRLREIAMGREVWCTECGYHTARRKACIGTRRGLSDEQVAEYVRSEISLHRTAGAGAFVLYQLNDGPSNEAIDRYGIRRRDGTLKPVSRAHLT